MISANVDTPDLELQFMKILLSYIHYENAGTDKIMHAGREAVFKVSALDYIFLWIRELNIVDQATAEQIRIQVCNGIVERYTAKYPELAI